MFVGGQILSSEFFSNFIAARLKKSMASQQVPFDFSFHRIAVSFFPLGIELQDTSVEIEHSPKLRSVLKIQHLLIEFNLFSLGLERPSFSNIGLEQGKFEFFPSVEAESIQELLSLFEKSDQEDLSFEVIQMALKDLPVEIRKIQFKDIWIVAPGTELYLQTADLVYLEDLLQADMSFQQIQGQVFKDQKEVQKIPSLALSLELSDSGLSLMNFSLKKKFLNFNSKGMIERPFSDQREFLLKYNLQAELPVFNQWLPSPDIVKLNSGGLFLEGSINGRSNSYIILGQLEAKDLSTNFFDANQLIVEYQITPKEVVINKLSAQHDQGEINLRRKGAIFDIENRRLTPEGLSFQLKNASIHNLLKGLPSLAGLQGRLNGEVFIVNNAEKYQIEIKDKLDVKNLKLFIGQNLDKELFHIERLEFDRAEFLVFPKKLSTQLSLEIKERSYHVEGSIEQERINFELRSAEADLTDFGRIAGLELQGIGGLSIDVLGTTRDPKFNIYFDLEESAFLGFELGKITGPLLLGLKEQVIELPGIQGKIGNTFYQFDGQYDFGEQDFRISFLSQKAYYKDLRALFRPLLKNSDFLPKKMKGIFILDFEAYGPPVPERIGATGKLEASGLRVFGQSFKTASFLFKHEQMKLNISEIMASQEGGIISGEFFADLSKSSFRYDLAAEQFLLSSINFYQQLGLKMEGSLFATLQGRRGPKISQGKHIFQLKGLLADAKVSGRELGDFNFEYQQALKFQQYLFELSDDKFSAAAKIYEDSEDLSTVSAKAEISQLREIFPIFSGASFHPGGLGGGLEGEINLRFPGDLWSKSSGSLYIKNLSLEDDDFYFGLDQTPLEIKIKQGAIGPILFSLSGPQGKGSALKARIEGVLRQNFSLGLDYQIPFQVLEKFVPQILSSKGFVDGTTKFVSNSRGESIVSQGKLVGERLRLRGFPTSFKNIESKFIIENGQALFSEIQAGLGKGRLSGESEMRLGKDFYLTADFKLKEAELEIFEKSTLSLNGDLHLEGQRAPFLLRGDLSTGDTRIINEFDEFAEDSEKLVNFSRDNLKYLPKREFGEQNGIFVFDILISTGTPILIRNSNVKMALEGQANLRGSEVRPSAVGQLQIIPVMSSAQFQNRQFSLSEGKIIFQGVGKTLRPYINFTARTRISDYQVGMRLFGPVDQFSIELFSDPVLSQKNILSLIALGYTDDLSQDISENDRSALGQATIGTFLFDKLKFGQTLQNALGLQVNLGTEVIEQEQNFLQGRTQSSQDSAVGQIRTATKVELRKRLSEALNLSVSSTVGGSIGQRQGMNLNYQMKDGVSLEGVYEQRTNEQGEEDIIDTSAGADLKFRWSFR